MRRTLQVAVLGPIACFWFVFAWLMWPLIAGFCLLINDHSEIWRHVVVEPLMAEMFPPEYYARRNAARLKRLKDTAYRAAAMRRARMLGAPNVEKIDRSAIFERDQGVCHLCLSTVDPEKYHLDHVIPLALGGDHTAANIKVAHPRCNLKKGAKLLASIAA